MSALGGAISTRTRRASAARAVPSVSVQAAVLATLVVAAATVIGLSGLSSRHAITHEALPVALAVIALWLFFSERYERSLAVLVLYLGLLDGVVKLASGSSVATLGRDLLLYAIMLGALARMILRRQRVLLPPLSGFVLAWIAVVVMQVANPADISLLHALASLRQHLEFVPLFFFGYAVLRSRRRLAWLLGLLLVIGAANGLVSLIQSQLTPAQLAAWGPGYRGLEFGTGLEVARVFIGASGNAHVRPPGLGGEDGFGGLVGMIAIPGAAALLANRSRLGRLGWLLLPATVLTILAVVTSQTRLDVVASVIALVSFLALTLNSRAGLAALALTVVIGAVGYVAISDFTSSSANRYSTIAPAKVINTAISARAGTISLVPTYFVRYPLGAGLGSVGPAAGVNVGGVVHNNLDGESELTFLLVETGIPGLAVMLAFTLATLRVGFRLRRVADPELQRLLMALTAVLIALFAAWWIGAVTSDSPGAPFIWGGAGCLAYWYGEMRAGRLALRPARIRNALALR